MRNVLFLLALAPSLAASQINTEAMRDADDWTGVRSQVGATFAVAAGNADFLQLGVDARLDAHGARDRGFVVGALRYSEADGARYLDRSFAHARLTSPVAGPLAGEVFAQVEQNAQQLLERRYLLGGGLRLSLVDRPAARLAVGVTPMFEFERLGEAAMEPPSRAFRVSSYLAARFAASATAAVAATVYAQPRMNDFADARVLGTLSAQVQATRWVALRVEAGLRHDSRPPAGVERTDLLVENGLVLTIPAR